MFRDSRWRLASLALLVLGLGSAAGAQEANPAPIKDAGGEVFGNPMDIPGIGRYVAFNDTEGNRASLLQAKM